MPDIFISKKDKENEQEVKDKKALEKREESPYDYNPVGFFDSFVENATNIHFEEEDQGEKILLFVRQHFIVNLKGFIILFLIALIPPIFIFINRFLPSYNLPFEFSFILLSFYYLTLVVIAYVTIVIWFFNIDLITNKRIVDVDFSDLFYNDVAVTTIVMIEDIDYQQGGLFKSYFNYGDVFVQTAAEKVNFDFLAVPKPKRIVAILQGLMGKGHKHD